MCEREIWFEELVSIVMEAVECCGFFYLLKTKAWESDIRE